jgi:CBS-domain-containing membrane protein
VCLFNRVLTSLFGKQAIELLSRFGYHRIPILDEDGQDIVAILSQSDVVRFLFANLSMYFLSIAMRITLHLCRFVCC